MSWDDYSNVLIAGGFASAGLYGFDSSVWSSVGETQPSASEIKAIVAGLYDGGASLQASGIIFGGVKYMKIGAPGTISGKKGPSAIAAAATGQCCVLGVGNMTPQSCLTAVEDLAADIKSKGY